jgi:ketosteroid isomerase-like protein
MSQENVEIVRRGFEAWHRGDVDGWVELHHPEIEWFSEVAQAVQGGESVYRGRTQLRQLWDDWHSVWDLTVEISGFCDLDEVVVATGSVRVHGKASGVDLEGPIAYVSEFEGGLIRTFRVYRDPRQALEAVGLSEQDAHA